MCPRDLVVAGLSRAVLSVVSQRSRDCRMCPVSVSRAEITFPMPLAVGFVCVAYLFVCYLCSPAGGEIGVMVPLVAGCRGLCQPPWKLVPCRRSEGGEGSWRRQRRWRRRSSLASRLSTRGPLRWCRRAGLWPCRPLCPNCLHPDGRSGPGKGIQDCGRHSDMLGWCAAVPWS